MTARSLALATAFAISTLASIAACHKTVGDSAPSLDASTEGPWRTVAMHTTHPEWLDFTDQALRALKPDVRKAVIGLLNRASQEKADAMGITAASELLYDAAMRVADAGTMPADESPATALRNGELAVLGGMIALAVDTLAKRPDSDAELRQLLGTVRVLRLVPRSGGPRTHSDDVDRDKLLQEARAVLGDDRFTDLMSKVTASKPR